MPSTHFSTELGEKVFFARAWYDFDSFTHRFDAVPENGSIFGMSFNNNELVIWFIEWLRLISLSDSSEAFVVLVHGFGKRWLFVVATN